MVDFTECFPLYSEEDKHGASNTFNTISDYVETQALRDLSKLFETYSLRENIDALHTIVAEAKERKKNSASGVSSDKDVWREDLEPRGAIAARTIPMLEREAKRLRESLVEVRVGPSVLTETTTTIGSKTKQLETANAEMGSEIEANVQATDEADEKSDMLFEQLRKVLAEWEKTPSEAEQWTVMAMESSAPPKRDLVPIHIAYGLISTGIDLPASAAPSVLFRHRHSSSTLPIPYPLQLSNGSKLYTFSVILIHFLVQSTVDPFAVLTEEDLRFHSLCLCLRLQMLLQLPLFWLPRVFRGMILVLATTIASV
ncbi:hypothetical protein D9757_013734 [Collybiopsis confluens]|uniref:Uncharacterized protein n=1 Tax=Collybiopsis confluens TaxID=2823264 RepID=A0A8H5D0T1_9AGAR|nr:hypothetical protein D9757_013734 [Collybiopsis confluens]